MIIQETPTLNLQFDKAKNDSDMLSLLKSQGGTFTRGSEVVGSGDSVASYVDALGTLRYAKLGHPRPNFVDGVNQGLLIEEERTNLLQHSENFDNAYWSKSNTTVTPNAIISPDGTLSGAKLIANTVSGRHVVFRTPVGIGASNTGTVSCYAKAGGYDFLALTVMQGSNSNGILYTFDLTNGNLSQRVLGGYNNVSATSKYIGDGWYRCSITFTNAASNSDFVIIAPSPTLTPSVDSGFKTPAFVGDGTSGIFIFGAQLEAGSFPTSYIPTKSTFVSRASTATYFDQNGVLQTAAINIPRDNNHGFINGKWVKTGLLAEESRTNLLQRSEEFDNAYWTKTRSTITPNATTAPDEEPTADKLVEDTSTTVPHFVLSPSISFVSGTAYTLTIFAKASERNHLLLRFGSDAFPSTDRDAWFNLSNGTVGTKGATVKASIAKLPNSWYKLSMTQTADATTSTGVVYILGDGENLNYTGNGTFGLFIWGAQLEAGSASSYIPTAGTTVTRSADITTSATVTRGAEFSTRIGEDLFTSEGTITVKCNIKRLGVTSVIFGGQDDIGLTVNNIRIGITSANLLYVQSGADIKGFTITETGEYTICFTFNSTSIGLSVNGVDKGNLAITSLAQIDRFALGSIISGANRFNSTIKMLPIIPIKLTDEKRTLLSRI